jgi:hypothetical protein
MPEPDEPFQVVWSEQNREAVRNLGKKALERGLGQQFINDVRHVEQQLETAPRGWGDPHFTLRATGATVCHGVQGLIHVYYSVHETKRLVFVKQVLPTPNRGLE